MELEGIVTGIMPREALESRVRSHRFNVNLLKLCEFGKLSFRVHQAEMLTNQREKFLFHLGPGGPR